MNSSPVFRRVSIAAVFALLVILAAPVVAVDDHLLLCEAVLTPTSDEFIEIANPTGAAISLDDYYLSDDEDYALLPGASGSGPAPDIGSSDFIAGFPPGSSIPAGGVIVVAFDGTGFETTFGFKADFEILGTDAGTPDMVATDVGATAGLTNSGENAVLFFWDGATDLVQDVDMVNLGTPSSTNDIADKTGVGVDGPDADTTATLYGTDAFTMPQQASDPGFGFSTKRILLETGNESAGPNGLTGDDETSEQITSTWDSAFTAPSPGSCEALPVVPVFIINELQADPDAINGDANGDGSVDTSQDEFVEIVNASGAAVDISGWTISDGAGLRHTFPGGTVVPDLCSVVVFGGGTPTGTFGNSVVQVASEGLLGLNNGGDDIFLNDGTSDVATATYGSEGGDNQSLTLDPDITGSLPFVKHSVATGSGGALFSPGTAISGVSFTGCSEPPPPENDWVINEVQADPDVANGDANGDGTADTSQDEFVEIVNTSGGAIDISGWTLSDAAGLRHTFPGGTVVPDQCSVVVFGGGAPTGTFGNSIVQTASEGFLGFNNGGDGIFLNDGLSDVATLTYGSEGGNDQSITRDPDITGMEPLVEHSTAPGSGGALFSPGTRVDGSDFVGCPAPASGWIINEINADPDTTNGDANGDGTVNTSQDEFVEIYNATGAAVDISGWTIADGFSVRHTFPGGTVVPDQCGILVFGGGTPTGAFGGFEAQVASGGQLGSNNGGDTVTLNDGGSDVAVAMYGGEGGSNQSLTLSPDLTGLPPYVQHSTAPGSGGTLFSPGTLVDGGLFVGCPPPPSPWVINEVQADPDAINGDANGDGSVDTSQDEFVEIVNNTGAAVDMSGWTLSDATGLRHTFPGGTVLPDECSVVVFGGGSPTGAFGNSIVQVASGGQLGLNNGGDTIALNDGAMDVAVLAYGSEGGNDQSITRDPDITGVEPLVEHSTATGAGGALFSPGTRIDGTAFFGCPLDPLEIFEIQGTGDLSPFAGQTVTTLDNIVTAVGPDSFFIQTPDARDDLDPNTSNGIMVFTETAPTVAVGDQVDVTGDLVEFFNLTEFTNSPMVSIDSSGHPLPGIVDLDGSTPSGVPMDPPDLERFEGMRVRASTGKTSSATNGFGDTCMSAGGMRLFREPGIEFPGMAGLPVWDGNPEAFEVDPDGLGLMDEMFTAGTPLGVEGVLTFAFGDYQILPGVALSIGAPPPLPRPVRPAAPGELTVATQNMLRLFNDVADGSGPTVPTVDYQARLDKFSRQIREVLGSPDVVALQEVENLATLQDLAAKIAVDDPTVVYTALLEEGNDLGGIDVGYLVRDTVEIVMTTQIGADVIFPFDGSLLNDRPPLVLEAIYRGPGGTGDYAFTAVVVHKRSLNGIDDPSDGNRVRMKRHEQALWLSQWIGARQTNDPTERLIVLGDFNAFEFTDGYVDVMGQMIGDPSDASQALVPGTDEIDPNLVNHVLSVPADDRYSFVFGCNAQVLDHILTTQNMASDVVEMAFGRGNADFPDDFELVPGDPLGSSDHDGAVLFVQTGAPPSMLDLTITSLSGGCPGVFEFRVDGLTPEGRVLLLGSQDPGTFVLNRGICQGTEVGLDQPRVLRRGLADMSGEFVFTRFINLNRCGLDFQAVELPDRPQTPMLTLPPQCATSDVETLP